MRYRLLLLILSGISCLPLNAQKLNPGPQVLTFFSEVDDTEQPYGLYLPPNYDPAKKYPFVMMLNGAGSNHRLALRRVFGKSNAPGETDVEATRYFPKWTDVEYIVASPFARGTNGYQGVSEKDVLAVLADVKARFSIDEDRTYLTGLSMGGGGTLWVGLTRPDVWAALAPVCPAPPKGTEDYLLNGFNMPMHFFHGDADKAVPVSVSRDWVKRLRDAGASVEYAEYPGVEHNSWENAYKDGYIFNWFSKFKRNLHPEQVKFSAAQYKYNRAYWVRLDLLKAGVAGSIDARFNAANQLVVNTTNVDAFTLFLKNHPRYNAGQALEITLNGKKVKVGSVRDSVSLQLINGKWTNSAYVPGARSKSSGIEGPLSEAVASRHIYVYGTGGNPSPEELKAREAVATKAADWAAYRNAFLGRVMVFPRILSDKEIRPSDFESSNLVLFGTKETNSVIERFADRLPLHYNPAPGTGLLYIFPIDNHFVLVNSGLPWWEGQSATGPRPAFPYQLLNGQKDYILFQNSLKEPIAEGYFDDKWQLSDEQKKALREKQVGVR